VDDDDAYCPSESEVDDDDDDDDNDDHITIESTLEEGRATLRDYAATYKEWNFLCDLVLGSIHCGGLYFHVVWDSVKGIALISARHRHKIPSLQIYYPTARNNLDSDGRKISHKALMDASQQLKGLFMMSGLFHHSFAHPGDPNNANHPSQIRNQLIFQIRALLNEVRLIAKNLERKFQNGITYDKNSSRYEFIYCLQSDDLPASVNLGLDFTVADQLVVVYNADMANYIKQFKTAFVKPLCALLEVDPRRAPETLAPIYRMLQSADDAQCIPKITFEAEPETRAAAIYAVEMLAAFLSGQPRGFVTKAIKDKGYTIFDDDVYGAGSPFIRPREADKGKGIDFPYTVSLNLFDVPQDLGCYEQFPMIMSPKALGAMRTKVDFSNVYVNWLLYMYCSIVSACQPGVTDVAAQAASVEDANSHESISMMMGLFHEIDHERLSGLSEQETILLMIKIGGAFSKAYQQVIALALQNKSKKTSGGASHTPHLKQPPRTDVQLDLYKEDHGTGFLNYKTPNGGGTPVLCETRGKI
jgi:hypothetical protein